MASLHPHHLSLSDGLSLRGLIEEAELLAEAIVDTVRESLLVLDGSLRICLASRSFYLTFRVSPEETRDRLVYEVGQGQWDIPRLRQLLEEILPHNGCFRDFEVTHDFPQIRRKTMLLNARKLRRREDQEELILLAIEDVTALQEAREHEAFAAAVLHCSGEALIGSSLEGLIRSWNPAAARLLGYTVHRPRGHWFVHFESGSGGLAGRATGPPHALAGGGDGRRRDRAPDERRPNPHGHFERCSGTGPYRPNGGHLGGAHRHHGTPADGAAITRE